MSDKYIMEACPFCGSLQVDVIGRWFEADKKYCGICDECKNHGPWRFSIQGAVDAWNEIAERAKVVIPMSGEKERK